jgi:hypothetical protein
MLNNNDLRNIDLRKIGNLTNTVRININSKNKNVNRKMLSRIPKKSMEAANESLVSNQGKLGGESLRNISSSTLTPDAAEMAYIDNIWDIGSQLRSVHPGQGRTELQVTKVLVHLYAYSSTPFLFSYFLCGMENGETITGTSSDETDPVAALDSATAAAGFGVKFGPLVFPRMTRDNGSMYWHSEITFNLTPECQRYLQRYTKTILEEENYRELHLGAHVRCLDDNTAVYIHKYIIIEYYSRPIQIGQAL